MERGVLKRLGELVGRKEAKGGWDGNERRQPRAVIGIPYSSDAAENTDRKEEEKIMKRIGMYLFTTAAVAAAAMILAACGGGGGTTSSAGGTTGTAVVSTGSMEKVNSVKVNGVTFSAGTAAKIRVEDNGVVVEVDATQANEDRLLRNGMQVKVKGQIDDRAAGKGQFTKVEAEPEVRGRIESGTKGADDFRVNGQRVIVDDNTVFEDRLTGGSNPTFDNTLKFTGINENERVEVHGGLDDLGQIRASRVERRQNEDLLDELTGNVTAFNGVNQFILVTGSANIPVALATGAVVTPSGSAIANNAPVEVYGSYSAGTFTANRVHIEDREDAEFEPAEGQEAEVEGFVGGFATGGTTFHVGSVDITLKTTTIFVNGSLADLVNGAKVEVEGHKKGTAIEADKVKFKHTRIILSGSASVNPPSTILGKTLRYTSATRYSWDNTSGKNPEVRGYDDGTGKVIVEELRDATSGGNKDIVQARVTAENGNTLTLFGFTADLAGISVNNLKDNKGGTYPNLAAFLSAITPASATPPGTLLKIKGTVTGSAFGTPPDEAEIEFED